VRKEEMEELVVRKKKELHDFLKLFSSCSF
jgi:hypothetical protein